jgi:hypothetical protein
MRRPVAHGMIWGDWQLASDSFTLVLQSGRHHYEVDLEDITDSAKMLDWIFQLRMKSWVTNDIIGDLISAFQDLLRPQNTICGQGINSAIDAKDWLNRTVTRH